MAGITKQSNKSKLYHTKLPEEDDTQHVDITDDVRISFEWETESLLINDVEVCEITDEIASELLKLVHSLGYTKTYDDYFFNS